jgi:exonuclease SbcC
MKLLALTLDNFRQHHQSRVEFASGLTGIIGPNGAGKSSIIEGILFGLFGSKALRGKVDDARTRGAAKDKRTVVELVWQIDGTSYRVRRELSDAELFLGGSASPICSGSREVTDQIEALIKMNLAEFTATYLTEQKGLDFLSGQRGAAERERFIGRMMGFDELESMQTLMRDDKRLLKAEIQGAEGVQVSKEDLIKRLALDEGRLNSLLERASAIRESLIVKEQEEVRLKEDFRRLERLGAEFVKRAGRLRELEVLGQQRSKRISEAELQLLAGKNEDPSALSLAIEGARDKQQKIKASHRDSSELALNIERSWREERTKRETEIRMLEGKLREIESKASTLSGVTKCPTCGQGLSGGADVKKHFQAEIKDLNQALFGCRARRSELENHPKDLVLTSELLADQTANLAALEMEIAELERRFVAAQRASELSSVIGSLRSEEATAQAEIQKVKAELTELRFSDEALTKAKVSFEAASRLVEVSRLEKVRVDGEVNTVNELIARLRDELVKFDERAKEVADKKGRFLLLEEGDLLLTAFRKHLSATIRPRLSSIAGEFLAELTDGRYTAIELGEDFVPTVIDDGTPKPVISGGEEDILNICMRLALSTMLAERTGGAFSLLILDEVFGSLDDVRRANVINLLERLRNRFEQILIITHLDDVRDSVQSVIEVAFDETRGAVLVDRENELLVGNF